MADDEISTKRCPKCKRDLPRDAFGRDKRTPTGLICYCRECTKVINADKRIRYAETIALHQKAFRDTHKAEIHERNQQYYAENRERLVAAEAARREGSREQRRAYDCIRWADQSSGRKERHAVWRAQNPEVVANSKRSYRARKKGAVGKHTQADIDTIMEMQKGKCAYCRTAIRKKYAVDHIVALTKGGTNWPTNLQLVCTPCNSRKRNKDAIDFSQQLGRLL